MKHIHRNKIAYRGLLRDVIYQGDNKYQIKFNKKIITVTVDAFNGVVSGVVSNEERK